MSKTKRCIFSSLLNELGSIQRKSICTHILYVSPAEYYDGENVYGRTAALGDKAVIRISISQ